MILDTCALLWLAKIGAPLPVAVGQALEAAPSVFISAITGFEVSLKHRKGRLVLPLSPSAWLADTLVNHRIDVLPITLAIAVLAAELPPIHQDPCDRLIIATAKLHGYPVVTSDEVFAKYGVPVIWYASPHPPSAPPLKTPPAPASGNGGGAGEA